MTDARGGEALDIEVVAGDASQQDTDALVVNLFSGVTAPGGATGAVDTALGGLLTSLIADGEVTGKLGEITVVHTPEARYPEFKPRRVLVAGLGPQEKFTLDTIRSVSAGVAQRLRGLNARNAATIVHGAGIGGLDPTSASEALVEGSLLGLYQFRKYKTRSGDDAAESSGRLERVTIVERDASRVAAFQEGAARAHAYASAGMLARDLVNEPPNEMTPSQLAHTAQDVAANAQGLRCTILDRPEIEHLGMRAYLGVAQGSHEPPKLIRLDYQGDPEHPERNIWLIGKGITFDSGGLSLKSTDGMLTMKSDMAGGASVIAAIQAVAVLKPRFNVTALCLATENMPGGGAQRVGDVVRSMSGKTIEIVNTDAEGRLTLADALAYARQNGAARMVDIATLTGGIGVALGKGHSGLFSNDDALAATVDAAGRRRGEPMWRLPLDDVSKKQNESKVADIKNSGGRPAHAITAAHFIAAFAEDTPWVHLDIASTAMTDSGKGWLINGATGVPTRALIQLVEDLASQP